MLSDQKLKNCIKKYKTKIKAYKKQFYSIYDFWMRQDFPKNKNKKLGFKLIKKFMKNQKITKY